MENNNLNNKGAMNTAQEEDGGYRFNARDFIFACLANWYWFVASVLVCAIVVGFVYKSTPKTYTSGARI